MKDGKCGFMKCDGHDLKCTLHNIILGDIMGYDGKTCDLCVTTFFYSLSKSLAKCLTGNKNNKKVGDCDYCRNAYTCDDLWHDNDLSYITLAYDTTSKSRVVLRTGNKQATVILVEENGRYGWKPTFCIVPRHCPNCGRELFENKKYLEKGKTNHD